MASVSVWRCNMWAWTYGGQKILRKHANRQNTNKSRKHLQFDNTSTDTNTQTCCNTHNKTEWCCSTEHNMDSLVVATVCDIQSYWSYCYPVGVRLTTVLFYYAGKQLTCPAQPLIGYYFMMIGIWNIRVTQSEAEKVGSYLCYPRKKKDCQRAALTFLACAE